MARPIRASQAGQCAVCDEPYEKGTTVVRYGEGHAHGPCAESARQRALINAGYTYASQRSSGWRLGHSPGTARPRY